MKNSNEKVSRAALAEAWLCRVPLSTPVHLASRMVSSRDWVIVKITTVDGQWGLGFCYAGYEAGEIAIAALRHLLLPELMLSDVSDPSAVWDRMYKRALLHGRAGVVQRCLSAIDIAIWDRNARSHGRSLSQHIGPEYVSRAAKPAVYVGAGYYEKGGDDQEADRLLSAIRATGTTAVKVKVGKFEENRESQRLKLFRQSIDSEISMSVDVNGAYHSAGQARSAMKLFRNSADICMIEDPFGPDDRSLYEELKLLRKMTDDLPVSTGELFTHEAEFQIYGEQKLADVFELDATCCGGITAFLRILSNKDTQHVSIETHWFPELHLLLAAACQRVSRVEIFADNSIINFGSLVEIETKILGMGLNLIMNKEAVKATLVDYFELTNVDVY